MIDWFLKIYVFIFMRKDSRCRGRVTGRGKADSMLSAEPVMGLDFIAREVMTS